MNNPFNSQKLSETRKRLLRVWTDVGARMSQDERPKSSGAAPYSLFAGDALWAFEWRNPVFCAALRNLLDIIPMRDGTFSFKYGFVCQTIMGWNGKVPNAGEMKVEELLNETTLLIKQHPHAAGEFRTLLLEYRHVGHVNLCRMIVNQKSGTRPMR